MHNLFRNSLFQEPRHHSFVAVAIGGAAVIGAGATVFASDQQAKSQNAATAANLKNANQTNQTNVLLNLASRGAPLSGPMVPAGLQGAKSAVLPYYFGPEEAALAGNATDLYSAIQAANGSPALQLQNYQDILNRYQPSFDANDALAQQLATGQTTQQMLAEQAPVSAQNLANVQTQKNAALTALQQTLNDIDTIQARKGFTGDSSASQALKFNARLGIANQTSQALGQAQFQNAQAVQGIQQTGRNMQLQDINLPNSLATAAIARKGLPALSTTQNFNTALQPFSFFNIGRTQPTTINNLPTIPPATGTGQIVGQTLGAVGGAASNALLQRALANQITASGTNLPAGVGSPGASVPGGLTYDPGLQGTSYNLPPVDPSLVSAGGFGSSGLDDFSGGP